MNPTEVIAQKIVTQSFIDADPDMIQLTRQVKVRNEAGGFTTVNPITLGPQKVKMIHLTPQPTQEVVTEGIFVKPAYDRFVGKVGCDAERGDTFEYEGENYEVVKVQRVEYETIVTIVRK